MTAHPAAITWSVGGTAVLELIDDDKVELVSTRAFAPGARPEGTFATGGHTIWLKCHGSRRLDDGSYRVKGRLLNVRREILDLLKEVVGAANSGKSQPP
jgi:hypothetical protein